MPWKYGRWLPEKGKPTNNGETTEKKKNKFGAQRHIVAGEGFPSKLEANVFMVLRAAEAAGKKKILSRQQAQYMTRARIGWKIDFKVQDVESGEIYFIEAKGAEDRDYALKKRMWKYYGTARLEIWKRKGKDDLYIEETIIPESSTSVCSKCSAEIE